MTAAYLATSARWIVGAVLLAAGLTKLGSPDTLAHTVVDYGILPAAFARPVATLLPPFEALLGLSLLLGVGVRIGGVASAVLFAAFAAAVAWNMALGNDIPCGCFGGMSRERIGPSAALRSALLFGLSVLVALLASPYLALLAPRRTNLQSLPPPQNGLPLALLASAVVAVYLVAGLMLHLRAGEG